MSEPQDDYEVGGAEIGPHLLQAHTFSEGDAKFYISDENISDENMKDMAENDPAFLSFAEKSRLLFGDKEISPELSVRDFFEANDISPSATVNEKLAFFIAQQQKVQSSKQTKSGSGKSAATPFSSKKGRPENGNKADSSSDLPSQSILFASPMPSNKSIENKENSKRVMHPQSEKISRRNESLRTPNHIKSTTEKPPLTASATYNSKTFQERTTAADYNYIHFDYAGISPRSSHAITMDNPATRSLYLQRQGSAVRRNTKRYGTPQLAGRLGVDRFPNAPTHFIRTWDGGAEMYTPTSAMLGGKQYSRKKTSGGTEDLDLEAKSSNEVDSSSNETKQNHEVLVTDAECREMEQARQEEWECHSEPDPELEREPEFESDDFDLALHDDQKISPESGSFSAEEEQEGERGEVLEDEQLQDELGEEENVEEELGSARNGAILPASSIAERFFNEDKRMALPAIHTSSTACLSFDENDMIGKADTESDASDEVSDTQTKQVCPRPNERRSNNETGQKKMGNIPLKTASPVAIGRENGKVETSCACVIQ